jgi:hypothetical protein
MEVPTNTDGTSVTKQGTTTDSETAPDYMKFFRER